MLTLLNGLWYGGMWKKIIKTLVIVPKFCHFFYLFLITYFIFIVISNVLANSSEESLNQNVSTLFYKKTIKFQNLHECLKYALSEHPLIKQSQELIKIANNKRGQIKANLDDKLTITTSFQRRKIEFTKAQFSNPKLDYITDSTSNSISYKKTISDFGRTNARLKSLDYDLASNKNDLEWNITLISAEVKSAWLKVRKSKALLEVQKNNLEKFLIHLDKVKSFVNVGLKPPYDITKAEVDVANAKVNLISAESSYNMSIVNLQKAIGINNPIELNEPFNFVERPEEYTENATFSINIEHLDNEALFREALEKRSDILSAKMALKSAELKLQEAKLSKQPTLSTSADYNFSGSTTPLDRNYTFILSLNLPVLDGKQTFYNIKEAISNYNIAKYKLDYLVINLKAELDNAILSLRELQQKLEATKVLVLQASETLYLAENRYLSGLGNAIELTDARNSYTNALGSFYTAFYDQLISFTNLEKILGRMPKELEN